MGEGGALRYLKAHGYIIVKREGIQARVSELGLDVRKLLQNVVRHSTAIFATVHSHGGSKPVTDSRGDQRRMLTISDAKKLLEGRTVRGLTATKEEREWVSLVF